MDVFKFRVDSTVKERWLHNILSAMNESEMTTNNNLKVWGIQMVIGDSYDYSKL